MADIIDMQIALAKRALRDAERRVRVQQVVAERLAGDDRQDADRVLGEMMKSLEYWQGKLAELTRDTGHSG